MALRIFTELAILPNDSSVNTHQAPFNKLNNKES
nr:MAG TPA: hypothetical protein [Caudoviricetes sp.]